MRRIWKQLRLKGLTLYQVHVDFRRAAWGNEERDVCLVFADSPYDAQRIMRERYGKNNLAEVRASVEDLEVLIPENWWVEGEFSAAGT